MLKRCFYTQLILNTFASSFHEPNKKCFYGNSTEHACLNAALHYFNSSYSISCSAEVGDYRTVNVISAKNFQTLPWMPSKLRQLFDTIFFVRKVNKNKHGRRVFQLAREQHKKFQFSELWMLEDRKFC